jgi:hypothetical protein
MTRKCSTHGRNKKLIQSLGRKPKRRDQLQDVGVDGKC